MTTELSTTIAGGPYAATAARRALGGLRDIIGTQKLNDVYLLVSELVTNGVRHGGAGEDDVMELTALRHGNRLRVVVTDWGPGFDGRPRPRNRADQTGGWGISASASVKNARGVLRVTVGEPSRSRARCAAASISRVGPPPPSPKPNGTSDHRLQACSAKRSTAPASSTGTSSEP